MEDDFDKLYEEIIGNNLIKTLDGETYIPSKNEMALLEKGYKIDDSIIKRLIERYLSEKNEKERKLAHSVIKKCPYCAEDIKKEAIKCKHCGEFIDKNSKTNGVIIETKKIDTWKIVLTILVIWISQGVVVNLMGKEQIIKDNTVFGIISIVWLPSIFFASYVFKKRFDLSLLYVFLSWLAVSVLSLGSSLATIEYAIIVYYLLGRVGATEKGGSQCKKNPVIFLMFTKETLLILVIMFLITAFIMINVK